ncbi:MAG: pentapeptide repeat-containing protein [Alphaproteobacteria bacterium]|nr:pentapeptide repeat-containing protein [Alphaproteobacteria bacterium]
MSTKIKYALITVFCLISSVVIAAVEPKNVVVFFLPAEHYSKVTSVQEAVPTVLPKGISAGMNEDNISQKDPNQQKHGIPTKVGVSLYDKGGIPLEQAANQIVVPTRVLILPPEELRGKQKKKFKPKTPESVLPVQLRIFPMTQPAKEIKKAAEERLVVSFTPLKPPADNRKRRPFNTAEWTGWILGELEKCNMRASIVLPTLYWLSANIRLTDNKTSCDMKEAVAAHLRKCHPWPVVYYTPINNDVPVHAAVQMAVEYLETDFERNDCPALNLTKINFEKVDFMRGRLKRADFSKSYFQEATFVDLDLSDALFNQALMDNVLFRNVDLSRVSFEKARMKYSHFHRSKAPFAKFDDADLQNAQFRNMVMPHSVFSDAVLQNTGWQDVRAYRLHAPRADFTMSGFDNVILDQMQAEKANFGKVSCKNCVLKNADLENAYFYGAFFEDTSFNGAQLSYADFRSVVFGRDVFLDDVTLYKANFGNVNLKPLSDLPIEKLTQMKIDKKTQLPEALEQENTEAYDVALDSGQIEPAESADRYICSQRTCEERLLGRASNQNLAVRAMTFLSNPNEKTENQIWALCTIGCIAKKDKRLENSQVDILAAFIKHKSPWDSQNDLFKPYSPLPPEVQMALYILTDPEIERDLGHDVNLTGTDLRTADLSKADLRNVDLSGSNLGGTNLRQAKTDLTLSRFDQVVIDPFTRFPKNMGSFKRFELPDSITPPWWKPAKVRVYKDGTHLWTVTTEVIPFSDEFIARPEKESENK